MQIKYKTFNEIAGIIAENRDISLGVILLESNLSYDLGVDSITIYEIIMEIERYYGISIEDEAVDNITTVEKLVDFVLFKIKD